jgi:hypothetical protein
MFAPAPLLLALACVLAAVTAAPAKELRYPPDGKYAFTIDLPASWKTKTDTRGGLLLIPPAQQQHTFIYLGIINDEKLRGQPDAAVAADGGKIAGVASFDKQEPARITDAKGAVHRGTAFYGKIEGRRLARRAKVIILPLAPAVWAQVWTVSQPGMNSVEYQALDKVLNSLTLVSE